MRLFPVWTSQSRQIYLLFFRKESMGQAETPQSKTVDAMTVLGQIPVQSQF